MQGFCTVTMPEIHEEKKREDVFDHQPTELVDAALSKLQAAGVKLIEWRALLYRRMGKPNNFSYAVPDDEMPLVSDILTTMGLPLSPHSTLLSAVEGDIHTKGIRYRLTRSSAPSCAQYLVIYPTSFVSFTPPELSPAPSLDLPSGITILVPRPSAVFAWILRKMLLYPQICHVQTVLNSDLYELLDYHFLTVNGGYGTTDEHPGRWKPLDEDGKTIEALDIIDQWGRNHEWRKGEEWFGDVLQAILTENMNIKYFPYPTKSVA
ncbi:hypothetical protein MD484_g6765, partial [Candolleomyces efflorescens]